MFIMCKQLIGSDLKSFKPERPCEIGKKKDGRAALGLKFYV